MSQADKLFCAMCEDIIENGTTTEGQKVRPHWEDGTPAYTIKQFGVRFGKPDEHWLDELTPAEAHELAEAGEFGKGSMEPKVLACAKFAESKPGRSALITLLEKAKDGLAGNTGTTIRA